MGGCEVEDGEEGFSFRALIVVGLGGAFIPKSFVVSFEVVVGFGSVGGVVTGLTKVGDVRGEI